MPEPCKVCGQPTRDIGALGSDGEWYSENRIWNMQSDRGEALFGLYPDIEPLCAKCGGAYPPPTEADLAALRESLAAAFEVENA